MGEPDAATDRLVFARLASGARVEQDEADCRPVPPPAPEAVPEAAVSREQRGAVHRRDFRATKRCRRGCVGQHGTVDPDAIPGNGLAKGGKAGEGGGLAMSTGFATFTAFRAACTEATL
jgi:hypothetical protein